MTKVAYAALVGRRIGADDGRGGIEPRDAVKPEADRVDAALTS